MNEALTAYLLEQARSATANVSVLMQDMDSGEVLFSLDSDAKVVSASTIKVTIMLCALDQVLAGVHSLREQIVIPQEWILEDSEVFEYGQTTQTLDELIRWMIITSDNTATNTLIHFLGMDTINTYARHIGLTASYVQRVMLDFNSILQGRNNYTSAQDQCAMYVALYNKSILTPTLCDYALDVLFAQRSHDDFMRYIPQNVCLAHKTGGLDHLNHDAGIFYLDNVRYFLGVFVTNAPDCTYAKRLIGRMSKAIYEEYSK